MSYSVDWVAKIFTIPQGDLSFLSGNNYSLSLVDVHEELRRLEWAFADGLWAPRIANWYETVTLSGIPKTPSVEITNGYTFDFTGSNYNVILTDYDNNLVDVYIPSNGISILGNNSVGRQTIVSGSGVTEQDKADIVDGVWDEQGADHKEDGSYGAELATKADIAAASSTDSDAAGAGSVIYGTQDSGTYLSTNVKDNTYWEIEEDAADGLTAELVFNVPDDNRAGVFRVFGRYEGTPGLTHYIELWVYNYEASAWEKAIEEFLPGGITSDSEYEQEYYERNIDRTNSNEVKVRLIHNVTTYNAAHHMFLDFAEVTSIDVTTAEDIADAVWLHNDGIFVNDMTGGRWKRDGTQMIFYKEDNVTEIARFDLKKFDGSPATEADTEVAERTRV